MYPSEYCGTALVVPIAKDPTNNNGVIVYDLRHDPSDLIELDADELRRRLFTSTAELGEGIKRPALKTIHINKCPVIVPENTLNDAAAERLQINREQHYQHLAMLNAAGDLTAKINQIFTKPEFESISDPDASLYSGGFFSDSDKRKMELIREADADMLATMKIPFDDARLSEMLFRYRARNWPESLNAEEQQEWQQYRQQCLSSKDNNDVLTLDKFSKAIEECQQGKLNEDQQKVLTALIDYTRQLKNQIMLGWE
jgi:exodeoxyribonuclease-1